MASLAEGPDSATPSSITSAFTSGNLAVLQDGLQRMRDSGLTAALPRMDNQADVRRQLDSTQSALDRIGLGSLPILGPRYQQELGNISTLLGAARDSLDHNDLDGAKRSLQAARERIANLGRVFDLETRIIAGGVPPGMPPGITMDRLLGSVEAALLDFGTPNQARGEAILRAAGIYAANASVYNAENPAVRSERDALLTFILFDGSEAQAGSGYPADQAHSELHALESFQSNVGRMASQLQSDRLNTLSGWSDSLGGMLSSGTLDPGTRSRIQSLKDDIDRTVTSMLAGNSVSADTVSALGSRYYAVSGTQPPMTDQERGDALRQQATDLRGTGTPRQGTAQWYGAQAQLALDEGNLQAATIAIAAGMLERAHAGDAARYLSPAQLQEINSIVTGRPPLSPQDMSRISGVLETAALTQELDQLAGQFPRAGSGARRERNQRVIDGIRVARERLANGDTEGARRLVDMDRTYASLLHSTHWGQWAGASDMEAGLDAEISGGDGSAQFSNGVFYHAVTTRTNEMRRQVRQWGPGLSAQRAIVESALDKADEYAQAGNPRGAQALLSCVVIYADIVARASVRRGDNPQSLNPHFDQTVMGGMESALAALSSGDATVNGQDAYSVFTASYRDSLQTYAMMEADRLGALAADRPAGRDTVLSALDAARTRAQSGDLQGALTILGFVSEYYGARGDGNAEGWRYQQASSGHSALYPGYQRGTSEMLEALNLEAQATTPEAHRAAAQLLADGEQIIAQTAALIHNSYQMRRRFNGEIPLVEGQPDTTGHVPMGQRRADGTYPGYLDITAVSGYEAAHPDDTVLRGGPTLAQLLSDCDRAARSGDVDAYNSAVGRFNSRFDLVTRRAARAQVIEQMRTQLTSLQTGLGDMIDSYNQTGLADEAAPRIAAIQGLRTTASTILGSLDALERGDAPLPLDDYASLLNSASSESRLATTYVFLAGRTYTDSSGAQVHEPGQIELTESYRQAVASERGDLPAQVAGRLATSRDDLTEARRRIANGDITGAFASYSSAINIRADALLDYRAEQSPTIYQFQFGSPITAPRETDLLHVPGSPQGDDIDLRFFPEMRVAMEQQGQLPGTAAFVHYRRAQTDLFSQMLTGFADGITQADDGSASLNASPGRVIPPDLLALRGNALNMLDMSIFYVPQSAPRSTILTDYAEKQMHCRQWADYALTTADASAGNQFLGIARQDMQWMEDRARRDDRIATYTAIGVGLAAAFIPEVGWAISGAIFTGLAADRVATEYRVNGHASTEAWLMLGLSVATLGLGGAAAGVGRLATAARASGALRLATGLEYTAFGMRAAGFGIGGFMTGYGFTSGVIALSQGRTEEGIVDIGMSLFPVAHMGARYAFSGEGGPTVRPTVPDVVDTGLPQGNPSAVEVRPTEVPLLSQLREPEGVFRFMQRLASTDPLVRAAAQTELDALPPRVRGAISGWVNETGPVRMALQAGEMNDLAGRTIANGLDIFGPDLSPAEPLANATRAQIDAAALTDPATLSSFVRDLLIPDSATQGTSDAARRASVARSAARSELARLRADNPHAAFFIDQLLTSPDYALFRTAVNEGINSPQTQRTLHNIGVQIGSTLPENIGRPVLAMAIGDRPGGGATDTYGIRQGEAPRAMGDNNQGNQPPGGGQPSGTGQATVTTGGETTAAGETSGTTGTAATLASRLQPFLPDLGPLLNAPPETRNGQTRPAVDWYLHDQGFSDPDIAQAHSSLLAARNGIVADPGPGFAGALDVRVWLDTARPVLDFGDVVDNVVGRIRKTLVKAHPGSNIDQGGLLDETPIDFDQVRPRDRVRVADVERLITDFRGQLGTVFGTDFPGMLDSLGRQTDFMNEFRGRDQAGRQQLIHDVLTNPETRARYITDPALRAYIEANPINLTNLLNAQGAIDNAQGFLGRLQAGDHTLMLSDAMDAVHGLEQVVTEGTLARGLPPEITFQVTSNDGAVTYNITMSLDRLMHAAESHDEMRNPAEAMRLITQAIGAPPYGRIPTPPPGGSPLPTTMSWADFYNQYHDSGASGLAFSMPTAISSTTPNFRVMGLEFVGPPRPGPNGGIILDLSFATLYEKPSYWDATYTRFTLTP